MSSSSIAILGISGRVGSRLAAELLRRGYTVTGIARDVGKVSPQSGLTLHGADASKPEQLTDLLRGKDVLVSAMRFDGGPSAAAVIAAAKQAGVPRLLVVGGAGSLEVAPGHALVDTLEFPAAYKPEALAGRTFLDTLRAEKDLDWSFLSPSAEFAPGERTGQFRVGGDQLLVDGAGESHISMEDFAIAMADEIDTPKHSRQRFTVGY